ncbi:MAG: hypothetical protein Q3999_01435 [Buchananella hordeovulneris]|nr:hypothetical protein [Buchananella hordeovulneris]
MRRILVAAIAGALALGMSACSSGGKNLGKQTTCEDFLKMGESERIEVLKTAEKEDPPAEPIKEEDYKLFVVLLTTMCEGQPAGTKLEDLEGM